MMTLSVHYFGQQGTDCDTGIDTIIIVTTTLLLAFTSHPQTNHTVAYPLFPPSQPTKTAET